MHDVLERQATRERRVEHGAGDLRHRAQSSQPADELLAEVQGVGLVVEEGGTEGRAEPEEEDEARDQPDLTAADRRADRPPRLEKRRLVGTRGRLAHERHAHAQ